MSGLEILTAAAIVVVAAVAVFGPLVRAYVAHAQTDRGPTPPPWPRTPVPHEHDWKAEGYAPGGIRREVCMHCWARRFLRNGVAIEEDHVNWRDMPPSGLAQPPIPQKETP